MRASGKPTERSHVRPRQHHARRAEAPDLAPAPDPRRNGRGACDAVLLAALVTRFRRNRGRRLRGRPGPRPDGNLDRRGHRSRPFRLDADAWDRHVPHAQPRGCDGPAGPHHARRPITALRDTVAVGNSDPATQSVWDVHVARMAARAAEARVPEPDLRLSARDPYALRYVAATALAMALLFGTLGRVSEVGDAVGLGPGAASASGPSWEGWVEPPIYTG